MKTLPEAFEEFLNTLPKPVQMNIREAMLTNSSITQKAFEAGWSSRIPMFDVPELNSHKLPNILCSCEHLTGYCDPTCPYCQMMKNHGEA